MKCCRDCLVRIFQVLLLNKHEKISKILIIWSVGLFHVNKCTSPSSPCQRCPHNVESDHHQTNHPVFHSTAKFLNQCCCRLSIASSRVVICFNNYWFSRTEGLRSKKISFPFNHLGAPLWNKGKMNNR